MTRVPQLRAAFLAALSPTTRQAYAGDLDLYLTWCADRQLDALTVDLPTFQRYQAWLETTPTERTGEVRAASTVGRMLSALSGWYQHLVRAGVRDDDPVTELERPRWARTPPKANTASTCNLAKVARLAATSPPRTWSPVAAELAVRLRLELRLHGTQICGLDLRQVQPVEDPELPRVLELRMAGRDRVRYVPIPAHIQQLIETWCERRVADAGDTALLVDRYGQPIELHQVNYLIRNLTRRSSNLIGDDT